MARLSMSEMTTFRWSFEEDVQHYVAAGMDGIAVWRQKLSDFGEEKGVELLAESPLEVSSLLWAGGFTGSDGRSYRDSLQDAAEAVQLAGNLGAACVIVYSGSRAGHTHNHARRLFKSALGELSPVARDCGVALAIEPMHAGCAGDWTFLTGLDDTLELIHAVGGAPLKLAFDAYHLGQQPAVVDRIADIVPLTAIVQLGDARQPPAGEQNRCPLGKGTIPLREIITALADGGYDGFFEVELIGEDVEQFDYMDLIQDSKQAFAALAAA